MTLLLVGILSISLPTVFSMNAPAADTLQISRVCALFVAVGYIAYLVFQLHSHADFFEDDDEEDGGSDDDMEPLMTPGATILSNESKAKTAAEEEKAVLSTPWAL